MFRPTFCWSNIVHTEHIVPRCHSPDPNLLQHQDTIPHAVNLSLTLLKMVKTLPETCWADLGDQQIVIVASSWFFLYYFTYIDDAQSNANQNLIVHAWISIHFLSQGKNALPCTDFHGTHNNLIALNWSHTKFPSHWKMNMDITDRNSCNSK